MSLSKILAQAASNLLWGIAGSRAPVLLNLKFTVGTTGAPTIVTTVDATNDAPSSIDWTITRVSAAVYDLTYNPCRRIHWGTLSCCAKSAAGNGTFAASDARYAVLDRSSTNTNAGTGKARICFATGASVSTELAQNSEMNLAVWADAG
jgi:hypothetical protein